MGFKVNGKLDIPTAKVVDVMGYAQEGEGQLNINPIRNLLLLVFGTAIILLVFMRYGLPLIQKEVKEETYKRPDFSRNCLITEKICPVNEYCRASNGNVTGATAVTPDGENVCCTFQCETYFIPNRPCVFPEKTCPNGSGCKMGDDLQQVTAIGPGGESCCEFDCN
jgi:hypothetical protein